MKRNIIAPVVIGALLGVVGGLTTPTASAVNDGLFSGTYSVAPYGDLVHVTSPCAQCDAIGTGPSATVTMTWNGVGWQRSYVIDGCGAVTGIGTPIVVVDGFVQELQLVSTGTCAAVNTTATWSRIGP